MPAWIHPGRVDPRFPGIMFRATTRAERDSILVTDRGADLPPRALAGLPDDQFVGEVARASLLDHELRHFHDLLLTPLGSVAVCTRLYAACNAFLVLSELKDRSVDSTVVPVPLQDWLHLSEQTRRAYLEQHSDFSGRSLVAPQLPFLDPDDSFDDISDRLRELRSGTSSSDHFVLACRAAMHHYRHYDQLWAAPRDGDQLLGPPTTSFWETPALLCQLAAVSERSGEDAAERLLRWMVERGPSSYRQGLGLVMRYTEALGAPSYARSYLTVATWAQLGPYDGSTRSLPLARLMLLGDAAEAGLRWDDDVGFLDQVAAWDEVVGSATLENLNQETVRLERSLGSLQSQGMAMIEHLAPGLNSWLTAHHAAKRAFLTDPDAYVDPFRYLVAREAMPRPAVAVAYDDPVASTSDLVDATPADWEPAIGFDDALVWASLVEATDALFLPGDRTLQPNGRRIVEQTLGLEPLRVIL